MSTGPTVPTPPDPPDKQGPPNALQARKRGSQKVARTSTNPSTTPSTPLPAPSPSQPLASELEAFDAGKARKRQATSGPEDRPSLPDPSYLDTPRSIRLKNLFTGAIVPPNLLDVARKLNDLVENNEKLPKKGAEKTTIGSETAADIKTLTARLLELAELNSTIPAIRRNPFSGEDEDPQAQRLLTSARTFGCKVPDLIEAKLEQVTKALERIERAATAPTSTFNFRTAGTKAPPNSYALAASKHATNPDPAPRPTIFKPVQVRKTPPAPPSAVKSMNTLTLAQTTKDGIELATLNYPTLIASINQKLAEAMIKTNQSDEKPISIRSVHRHPSNDLVLYTTTAAQADALRAQHEKWVPLISTGLELHNPVHTVVVHGIPTSFDPSDAQHLEMLSAMNPDTLTPPPPLLFVKWISANAVQRGATHSSIRIGFTDAERAARAVEHKVFYGRFNKRTEFGRKNKPRCMNCLKEGHTTRYCKETLMCPYCSKEHAADTCDLHGKMTTNCTACARHARDLDPGTDLKALFAEAPRSLRHSPLDPTCPARIAGKLASLPNPGPTVTTVIQPSGQAASKNTGPVDAMMIAENGSRSGDTLEGFNGLEEDDFMSAS